MEVSQNLQLIVHFILSIRMRMLAWLSTCNEEVIYKVSFEKFPILFKPSSLSSGKKFLTKTLLFFVLKFAVLNHFLLDLPEELRSPF